MDAVLEVPDEVGDLGFRHAAAAAARRERALGGILVPLLLARREVPAACAGRDRTCTSRPRRRRDTRPRNIRADIPRTSVATTPRPGRASSVSTCARRRYLPPRQKKRDKNPAQRAFATGGGGGGVSKTEVADLVRNFEDGVHLRELRKQLHESQKAMEASGDVLRAAARDFSQQGGV